MTATPEQRQRWMSGEYIKKQRIAKGYIAFTEDMRIRIDDYIIRHDVYATTLGAQCSDTDRNCLAQAIHRLIKFKRATIRKSIWARFCNLDKNCG